VAKVSVIIPTFGRSELVCRAVETALAQTFQDLDVLVVIDGADPATEDALGRIADPRLRFTRNTEKLGAGRTRDRGAALSTGEWIAFLDDDDIWLPNKIELQLVQLEGESKALSSTQAYVVSATGTTILPREPHDPAMGVDEWLFGRNSWFKPRSGFAQTSTLLVPRSLLSLTQFGNGRHEDWEFVIRAVKEHGYVLKTVMQPLVIYKAGGSYVWENSLAWLESARPLLSARAYSGFCLTVASQDVPAASRNRAMWHLLRLAFGNGRPTAKQLFAFALIWLLPDDLRRQLRGRLKGGDQPNQSGGLDETVAAVLRTHGHTNGNGGR